MSDTLPGDRFGRTGYAAPDEPELETSDETSEEDEARESHEAHKPHELPAEHEPFGEHGRFEEHDPAEERELPEIPELPDRFGAREELHAQIDSELESESESELEHEEESDPVSALEPETGPVSEVEPEPLPEPSPVLPAVPESEAAPVLAHEATSDLRMRWSAIQAEFIDDPKHAVEDADRFVIDVARAFASSVESRRRTLNSTWAQDGQKETEELRLTMRQYRALVDRILIG